MGDSAAPNPSQLGVLVKDYKLSSARVREIILIMVFSAGMASVCLLTAIFDHTTPLYERIGVSLLGLFISLPLIFGVRQLALESGVSLSLYENGLIFRRQGKAYQTTWDEINSYNQESACRITKNDGTLIEFGLNIENADEVADAIQEQTLKRMLPQVKTAIKKGSSVEFKALKLFGGSSLAKPLNNFAYAKDGFFVDAEGIRELESGRCIAWQDVEDYGVATEKMGRAQVDVFFIQDANTVFRMRYGLLSNAHVLLAVCEELTG